MEITESSGSTVSIIPTKSQERSFDDYYNFKAQAFYDIAQAYNSRNFDDVTKICKYMLQFSADEDFTNEQTTLKKVTDGDVRTNTAAREARKTASAAEEQADANQPGDTSSGNE